MGVVEDAQDAGRHLQHHRPVLDVDDPPGIDHDRVRGQEQRAGVRQALGDAEGLVRREAAFDEAPSQALDIGRRNAQHEGFHAANEVEVVVDLPDGFGVGEAVVKLQRPDARLHRVGRRDRRRNLRCVFRGRLRLRGSRHTEKCSECHEQNSLHTTSPQPDQLEIHYFSFTLGIGKVAVTTRRLPLGLHPSPRFPEIADVDQGEELRLGRDGSVTSGPKPNTLCLLGKSSSISSPPGNTNSRSRSR